MIFVRVHFWTLHEKSLVTSMTRARETSADDFFVVANHLGQHSLWNSALTVPRGWRRRSGVMPRSDCLKAIEAAWPDIAPATVSSGPGERPSGGERFVHEFFAGQAATRPDSVAIVAGRARVTYRELDESAAGWPLICARSGWDRR